MPDEVAFEIVRSIRRIMRRVATHSKQLQQRTGLTVPQILVLRAVAQSDEDDATVVQIGRTANLTPSSVSGVLDRLERAGLVERHRGTKQDRRKVHITLTEAGLARLEDLPELLHRKVLDRLESLDEGARAELLDAMRTVEELLEAEDIDVAPVLTLRT